MGNIIKCKMCGGDLNIHVGAKIAECMYCGSMQTIPNIDDERRANLYVRAGQFRLNGDFDKAASIYDEILRDDNTDAEAHWSIVLCKYGIEYVQDPKTKRRIPTVNRMQYTSIFNDPDYQETLKYADLQQRQVYEYEAQTINSIQNGILEISRKEKPFDIFISYKETDSLGRRTQDSVYAYDIYERLTQEGYRVFFSRVTLESVVGTAYEPYIFAALNSAKVMIVVGTSAENMNAVWVRNEWSRFLLMMQQDKSKSLIPVYKDMNPYDLPAEFAYLQAQDMNRLGFIQDLVRGINKIIKGDKDINKNVLSTQETTGNVASVESLLKRVDQFIDAGDWKIAEEYCNRILDIDPECALAHFNLFCCKYKLKTREEIIKLGNKLKKDDYIKYAFMYANKEEKEFLIALRDDCEKECQEEKNNDLKKILAIMTFAIIFICLIIGIFFIQKVKDVCRENAIEVKENEPRTIKEERVEIDDDSDKLLSEIEQIQDNDDIKKTVRYGMYQWYVLTKNETVALLLAAENIETKKYNDTYAPVSWETCTLRKWLNTSFIEESFSNDEIKRIVNYNIPEFSDVSDKVFILNYDEIIKYHVGTLPGWQNAYWLRSTNSNYYADTSNYENSHIVTYESVGVRPVMFVNIKEK